MMVALAPLPSGAAATCLPSWQGYGEIPGVDGATGHVEAMAVHDDGSGEALYVGGTFLYAGNKSSPRLARWTGTAWESFGPIQGNRVQAMTSFQGQLVVGGSFSKAGTTIAANIASWNGNIWKALGSGTNSTVNDLVEFESKLVAVGVFSLAGGQPASNVAAWDGTQWIAFGEGIGGSGSLQAATIFQGQLVVGGNFTVAGGIAAEDVARWNGDAWEPLGAGLPSGSCYALASFDPDGAGPLAEVLLAGGTYGDAAMKHLLQWDGTSWTTFQGGANSSVWTLEVLGTDLWVGGRFRSVDDGGFVARHVARYNAASGWSAMGNGLDPSASISVGVNAIVEFGGAVHVGGEFFSDGLTSMMGVGRWDGTAWSALGTGPGGDSAYQVNALVPYNGGFVAGGYFATLGGGAMTHNVALRTSTGAWAPLGDGLGSGFNSGTTIDDEVTSLVADGNDLYAGHVDYNGAGISGRFSHWDGTSWTLLFSVPTNQFFNALVVHEGAIYAGGTFTTLGGVSVNRVAQIQGMSVSPLGAGTPGVNGDVRALASFEGDLIVGGTFTQAGGTPAARVARFDGTSWSALGAGIPQGVHSLHVHEGALHAGADNGIYKWDGSSWTRIVNTNGGVLTMLSEGEGIYFGGTFTVAQGKAANGLAVWDGALATSIGTGVQVSTEAVVRVSALLSKDDGTLLAGGNFLVSGQKVTPVLTQFEACAIQGTSGLLPEDLATLRELGEGHPAPSQGLGNTPVWSHFARANCGAQLQLELPAPAEVTVDLFDVAGRRLTTWIGGRLDAGSHRVSREELQSVGRFASGVTFARVSARAEEGSVHTIVTKFVWVE